MKLYTAVAQGLLDNGVSKLFGVMGDGNMHYIAEFVRGGGEYVASISEGGGVSMADGFSRVSGLPGIATVTHGPGTTNAITAMITAARAHSSVLLLTGRTPSTRGHLQEVDLRSIADTCGIEYRCVLSAEHVVQDVLMALDHIIRDRRPIMLDIAHDLLSVEIDYRPPTNVQIGKVQRISPDPDAVDTALGIIASSRRPLVVAGRGAVLSQAREEISALADLLKAPVATTLLGKDFFRGHDLDLGIMGTLSHDLALDAITESDCIVSFGAGLNKDTTVDGDLIAGKAIVQCDVDSRALGKFAPVGAGVVGDAAVAATTFTERLHEFGEAPWVDRSVSLRERLQKRVPQDEFVDRSRDTDIDMRTAMIHLDSLLPPDRALVTDCGRFTPAPWRYIRVSDPRSFTHTVNFGSIGLGISTAIGMSMARPDQLTVAVVGDAGGMMGISELSVAVRYRLPLLVVMLNDGSYGSEYRKLDHAGLDPKYSLLEWPEFAGIARAYGARAATVHDVAGLESAVRDLTADRGGPALIDVKADPAVDIRLYP